MMGTVLFEWLRCPGAIHTSLIFVYFDGNHARIANEALTRLRVSNGYLAPIDE
jgi:hypothetical protein